MSSWVLSGVCRWGVSGPAAQRAGELPEVGRPGHGAEFPDDLVVPAVGDHRAQRDVVTGAVDGFTADEPVAVEAQHGELARGLVAVDDLAVGRAADPGHLQLHPALVAPE